MPVKFKIDKDASDSSLDGFTISPNEGEIPPGESFSVTVTYAPKIMGVSSSAKYWVKTHHGNKINIYATGNSLGVDACLSSRSINFGEVHLGNNTNRVVNVENWSSLPTKFQFNTDFTGTFSFSQICGTIPPRSSVRIVITFEPKYTNVFYQRVFCVIWNHVIQSLDLIGTCYDILTKPLPLM